MPRAQESKQLPDEVFHGIATTIQRLIYIVENECGIAPIDLLTLWYIDYFGKVDPQGLSVMLRRNLTQMLTIKFRLSDSQVTAMLDELQDKGLVRRTTVNRDERKNLFGSDSGPRLVVILTPSGVRKFDLFKERLLIRYERWLSSLNAPTRVAVSQLLIPVGIHTAKWVIKRYDPVVLASLTEDFESDREPEQPPH